MNYEHLAALLDVTGDYRVLRRLHFRARYHEPDGTPTKVGLLLDIETTGLDPNQHEVIELAMLPFTYADDGRVFNVLPAFSAFNEPRAPILPEIAALTHIDDTMVKGHRLDLDAVSRFAAQADIVVAHNAAFDRPFVVPLAPVFASKLWACSMTQVPWAAEGFDGRKLNYLATECGFFFHGHRAEDDCRATLEVLTRRLPRSGDIALAALLRAAPEPSVRIVAVGAAFEAKDWLKARGYRWSNGSKGPKAWWRDVPAADAEAESRAVEANAGVWPGHVTIDAIDRFSAQHAW